jgi:isopenicillin-N epimerase
MTSPDRFGSHLRNEWMLDPAVTYLNHGTVGAPPRRIIETQRRLQDEIERQPATFLLRELADDTYTGRQTRLRLAMKPVADYLGCDAAHTGFVDNITTGANAVLRSFPFQRGDEIVVTNLGYPGVTNAAIYAARTHGIELRSIVLPGPGAEVQAFVDAVAAGLSPRTRILVTDHITAATALVLPIQAIADACHDNGTLLLVDGAHAPGAIPVDILSIGADWYTGNLHKWMWTPRSSGMLWAAPDQREHLHAAVISWGLDQGIAAEFDLPGTRDPSAHLTAPAALEMRAEWGEQRIREYNHDLAMSAGALLARHWGVAFETPEEMIGTMVTVPLPDHFGYTSADAQRLRDALLRDHAIEVPTFAAPAGLPPGLSMRISCQVYNSLDDIERLAAAVVECVG